MTTNMNHFRQAIVAPLYFRPTLQLEPTAPFSEPLSGYDLAVENVHAIAQSEHFHDGSDKNGSLVSLDEFNRLTGR